MPAHVKAIPEGYHTATPYLTVHDAAGAIEFYKRAFGAKELLRMPMPGGKVAHAEIKIGDSVIMLGDEMPNGSRAPRSLGGTTAGVMLYVEDCDKFFNQATAAGAKVEAPLTDMFWGDRYGKLTDPYGHSWAIATHKEDVAPAEMEKRMKEYRAKMAPQQTRSAH